MPSPLKRPSLVRLLSSLRPPPSRPGSPSSFPVQTGFPTSLADLVVRNHGRLRKPRKQRRTGTLASPPSPYPVAAVEEIPLTPPPPQPLSPVAIAAPRPPEGAAFFRLSPEVLVVGGAVALALLTVWREGMVAALTVAAVSLLWIESASRRRQRRRPAEAEALPDSCVLPIREAEVSPRRSSCSDSDKGSEPPSPQTELVAGGEELTTPRRKGHRSLRKLISKKLQKKLSLKDSSCPLEGEGEAEHPEAVGDHADPVVKTESLATASESNIEEWLSSSSESTVVVDGRGPGVKFPLAAFVPLILAGLAAGKLPATALAVLCVAFFSGAVQRLQ